MASETSSRVRTGLLIGALVLGAIAVLYSVGFYAVLAYTRRGMSAEEIAAMDRYFHKPVEIPEQWREVEPFPDELVEAGRRFMDDWGSAAESASYEKLDAFFWPLFRGKAHPPEEWEELEAFLADYRGYRSDLTALVSRDDYEMDAFPGDYGPNLLMIHIAAEHLCLESYFLAHRGEWNEAFEPCVTVYRMCRRHPASLVVSHLMAFACETLASTCIARIAPQCPDQGVLRSLLQRMNDLDPEINLDVLDRSQMIFVVGELRRQAREGVSVDLDSRKPLYRFEMAIGGHTLEQHDIELDEMLGMYRYLPGAKLILRENLYRLSITGPREGRTEELSAKARYDLARLTVASRIHELETGPRASSVEELSDFFPEPLLDPFTGEPYRCDREDGVFYSIGPDDQDNSIDLRYDATNGTVSSGDIFFEDASVGQEGHEAAQ